MTPTSDFNLYCPVSVFTDASKSDSGKSQRIAGIISTDELDSEGERVLQEGLDFSQFLGPRGYMNDDHKTGHHDLLGVPEFVQSFDKGAVLPNGTVAKNNLTWCEGYLLDTEGGRKTYEIARALQGTGKSLGFSIEGSINQRQGLGGKIIGKASVRHVAITHQPVNQGTTLEALVRSLRRPVGKATTVAPPAGNATNLVRQNLSRKITNLAGKAQSTPTKAKQKRAKKMRSLQRTLKSVFKALPHASVDYALWVAQHIHHQGKAPH